MTRQRKFPMWLFQVRAREVCVCYLGSLQEESCQPMTRGPSQGGMTLMGVPHRAQPGTFPAVDPRHVCSSKSKTAVNKNAM